MYHIGNKIIDSQYVDGLSLTHGVPGSRQHIWTFASGLFTLEVTTVATQWWVLFMGGCKECQFVTLRNIECCAMNKLEN